MKSVLSRTEVDDVRPEDVVADSDVMKSVDDSPADSPKDVDQREQDSAVEEATEGELDVIR